MDLQIAFGEKDPAADMGVIPAQGLQTVQLGVRGGGRDELRQTLLIFLRQDKPGAHGMLALEGLAGKDAERPGSWMPNRTPPVSRSARTKLRPASTSRRICSSTAEEHSIKRGHCGIRQVLRLVPGPVRHRSSLMSSTGVKSILDHNRDSSRIR